MDTGVPIRRPVAGISVGLFKCLESGRQRLVTDIMALEDSAGDVDFKIAGTELGATAFQLNIKIPGVPLPTIFEAIDHGVHARSQIFELMKSTASSPRVIPSLMWRICR
jgi:polyribonucleotide nucleotidyltransferase